MGSVDRLPIRSSGRLLLFFVREPRVEKVSCWVACSVLVFYIFKLSLNLRPSITAIKIQKVFVRN